MTATVDSLVVLLYELSLKIREKNSNLQKQTFNIMILSDIENTTKPTICEYPYYEYF
jgi:hypothetical protein